MPYKISGTKSETSRILILKESDWSIESNTIVSGSGVYEIDELESGNKIVVSRTNDGEMIGFGAVSSVYYEPPGPKILDNPNPYGTSVGDYFGYSVAISGNYAIVGAYGEDDAGGGNSGKAYIFNVTTGALLKTLDNPNAYGTSASDLFGASVAISGDYAIVGAFGEGDAGGTESGKAYIFNIE